MPVSPAEIAVSLGRIYLSQTNVITIGRQEGLDLSIQHSSLLLLTKAHMLFVK